MDYKIQIISLIYSYSYGIFFYFYSLFNDKFMTKNNVYNISLLLCFIILNSLIYITVLYKINFGVVHIYFFIMIFLGYYFAYIIKKVVSNNVKSWKIFKKNKKL